ncbi:PadR family transcriptional regulator [Methanocella arvoryzae]|uniref:Transcription regulator (PadR-like) n=1 Tax=Methanocella arvoryzae (strain DSM 22066 / NBRC 105507 / MRE50) TaxID=351160 RepID=Q0W8K0_METAR|nr:PadR family transcriptional regulator [Methanocella arvoryzae]CAJ35293.1 putative transcription regulator (PadR-like) [Methanocella arvoryzae MRE50]
MHDDVLNNEMRKGFLKVMLLHIVQERPSHGYEIIQEIGKKTHGGWAPSPGSVYPALDFLEKRGYIQCEEVDRKKVYSITEKGVGALDQIHARRQQWIQELNAFFGDVLEENHDGQ